jgi:secreted trypsin-like serine protease
LLTDKLFYYSVSVRLGEWDTSTEQDCDVLDGDEDCVDEPVQDIPIEQIIPHEKYDINDKFVHNDIAVIRLQKPAVYNFFVKPICLPLTETLRTANLDGLKLTVAGWGKTEMGSSSTVKLKVDLEVVPLTGCQEKFKKYNLWSKQLCAGGKKGQDSCKGDSGGPLMKEINEGHSQFWYIAGVVSFGSRNCGTVDQPGVYTKVGDYFEWILRNIRA